MSQRIDPPARPGESLGELLTRLRQAQGKSQVRLAGLLCAASGLPTLTRHEISRWEREERVPSRVWLGWLAFVLDTPLDDLERAAALTRRQREPTMTLTTTMSTTMSTITAPPPPTATALAPALAPAAVTRGQGGAGQGGAGQGGAGQGGGGGPDRRARIAELRRMDDLLAGPELLAMVLAELRAAARDTAAGCGAPAQVAELAQLHTWVAADAGRHPPDGVQRGGVRAALAAGDRPWRATCSAATPRPSRSAVTAGRAAGRVHRRAGRGRQRPGDRDGAVAAGRVRAAHAGERRTCDTALAAAEDMHSRRVPGADPPWLYWLDGAHVDALAGLSLAAAGRSAAALPRLAAALRAPTARNRTVGLVSAAAAHAHLGVGDLDAACDAATETLLTCVDSGSFRVLRRLRRVDAALHATIGAGRPAAALRVYADLAGSAAAYLPGGASASGRPAVIPIGTAQVPGRVAS
ncbi:helix-turn-helix domain-containing protein [Dactylosporangium sp. NBC_01737]|uniref:helix-turn-helix transcriptional regulator n=1 Tax=Dactylosporangium sp. NBC_01737 TaxID=2975959 RepID=UPI002E11DC13|nr:helix-turn-helix domain-containing protein [Dactylosporangium sp. NBC_01737]